MGAVRKEREPALQREAARALVELVAACVERKPSPSDRCRLPAAGARTA